MYGLDIRSTARSGSTHRVQLQLGRSQHRVYDRRVSCIYSPRLGQRYLCIRSLNTIQAIGNKDDPNYKPDPGSVSYLKTFSPQGIRAPERIRLRVCSAEEARRNWKAAANSVLGKNGNLPCDGP